MEIKDKLPSLNLMTLTFGVRCTFFHWMENKTFFHVY